MACAWLSPHCRCLLVPPPRLPASQHTKAPPCLPAVLSDAVPLVLSRQLLLAFAQSLQQLQPDAQQAVAT